MCKSTPTPDRGCDNKAILRISLLVSLLVAAGVCAGVAYTLLSNSETKVFEESFSSLAEGAAISARQLFNQKVYAANTMATMFSFQFPNAEDWPMIDVPGYLPVSNSLARLSGDAPLHSFGVVVAKDQVADFEEHAKGVYKSEGLPEGSGSSDFGFGAWKYDRNDPTLYEDGRFPNSDGEPNWDGKDPNLFLVLFASNPILSASLLLYNVYSEQYRGVHIDAMKKCSEEHSEKESLNCVVSTDIQEVVLFPGEPSVLLFHPVYPANNPGQFVGFSASPTVLKGIFKDIIPKHIDGLILILETETQAYTFEIREGLPYVLGKGDLHDPKYDKFKSGPTILNDYTSYAATSVTYKLTIYPSEVMLEEYQSNTPVIVVVSLIAIILVISAIFLFYDVLVRRERRQLKAQLDRNKQQFARRVAQELDIHVGNGKKVTIQALAGEYNRIDKNSDDSVSRDELKEYIGDEMNAKDFEAMWTAIDLDNNGTLDFNEFCNFMTEIGAVIGVELDSERA